MGHDKRILITGATGFVGRRLLTTLSQNSALPLIAAVRKPTDLPTHVHQALVADLDAQTDWRQALRGVDVVVHLAARVHVMSEQTHDPLSEFRRVNVAGTLALARQAAEAGVRRFVFVSSIKVNGERTTPGHPFTAEDVPAPVDPYGVSKAEAEAGLRQLAESTAMEVVILRPPLIYGPGVKANFAAMMSGLQRGLPLPLGNTGNARSLLALDNLVDLIIHCLDHPGAANQTFLASDCEDLSTTALLQQMGAALGHPARLFPFPRALIWLGARALGKGSIYQRLFGSLQLDTAKTRQLLAWTPPLTVQQALQQVAADFIKD